MRKLILAALLVSLVLLLSGCGQTYAEWQVEQKRPSLSFDAPFVSRSLDIPVSAETGKGDRLIIDLVAKNTSISVSGTDRETELKTTLQAPKDGEYEVVAVAERPYDIPARFQKEHGLIYWAAKVERQSLIVDTVKPTLTDVSLEPDGDRVRVTGQVSDATSGVTSVTLDGWPTQITDDTFVGSVPYRDVTGEVAIQAVDRAGNPTTIFESPPVPENGWIHLDRFEIPISYVADRSWYPNDDFLIRVFGTGFSSWMPVEDGVIVGPGVDTNSIWYFGPAGLATATFLGFLGRYIAKWLRANARSDEAFDRLLTAVDAAAERMEQGGVPALSAPSGQIFDTVALETVVRLAVEDTITIEQN